MNTERRNIAVIGGGASGLVAAVTAARAGAHVQVFEKHPRVGKTILVTGDGRCNIANAHTDASVYRNAAYVQQAFDACNPVQALRLFEDMGLVLRQEDEGRLYPLTNKATSVVDVLRAEMQRAGVVERCGKQVLSVRPQGDAWQVRFADAAETFDAVIVACGGAIARTLLPDDVAFAPMEHVLGPLATDARPLRGLDKVRVKAALTCENVREQGEVAFRKDGISGIVAFNMSRIARPDSTVYVDFLPQLDSARTDAFLTERFDALQPCTWNRFCCGMLLPLVAQAVLRAAQLQPEDEARTEDLPALARALRSFSLTVHGIADEKRCQVHRGGIKVQALCAQTGEVALHRGMFACGEAVDVDAPCGGYNLHWAWVSGIIAGRAAASAHERG